MHHRLVLAAAVAAALLLLPAAAGAAGTPANVGVRVEGKARTLVPRTVVTTAAAPVVMDGRQCSGTSDGGALNAATGGDWHATFNAQFSAFYLDSIKGEAAAGNDYWSVWINGRYAQQGTCLNELQEGDDLLYFVDHCDPNPAQQEPFCLNAPVLPLELGGPRTVALGTPFTVTVVSRDQDGKATPIAGATVAGGGLSATTDAVGRATLTLAGRGDTALVATKAGLVRTGPVPVCATDGADGFCGTRKTGPPTRPAAPMTLPPVSRCATTGDDGRCGTFDRRAPLGQIKSMREHQRFARRRAPRRLAGIVAPDPSGIRDVRLRLTRNDRGRCARFDARRERFARTRRCSARRGTWFSVGDRQSWSYLLPQRLGRGRYVLDVRASDKNGNVDAKLQRTRNRVVFFVR